MKNSDNIYKDNSYLSNNSDWHEKDSKWKFDHIVDICQDIQYKSVVDIGCGAGKIIEFFNTLNRSLDLFGYDITDNVQSFWKKRAENIKFKQENFLNTTDTYDLLLLMDVFEHVEDYYSFLKQLSTRSKYFVFHIPLDMCALASITDAYTKKRNNLGHLHYYDHNTALSTLEACNYNIIRSKLTKAYLISDTSISKKLKYLRKFTELILGEKLNSRILGGYSMIVLCERKG